MYIYVYSHVCVYVYVYVDVLFCVCVYEVPRKKSVDMKLLEDIKAPHLVVHVLVSWVVRICQTCTNKTC